MASLNKRMSLSNLSFLEPPSPISKMNNLSFSICEDVEFDGGSINSCVTPTYLNRPYPFP